MIQDSCDQLIPVLSTMAKSMRSEPAERKAISSAIIDSQLFYKRVFQEKET